MSTVPVNSLPPTPSSDAREIRIVSHSTLFYWWPVWAVGFIMAAVTAVDQHVLAVVPEHTQVVESTTIDGREGKHVALVLPANRNKEQPKWSERDSSGQPREPHLHISSNKNLGVLFCTVLLLVIAITNVSMRGLWSVIVIVTVIFLSIIFALLHWWAVIFEYLTWFDIRINMAGYLFISGVLLVLWLIVFLLFDKQIYMVFTPGQLRVRLEIGEAETAYDTAGMTIQKQRSDLFRHWILGFGSGDLIVRTSGAQAHTFDMPNVLFVGRRIREIEEMLRSRPVVASMQQHV